MVRKVLFTLFFVTMSAQENKVVSKLETIDIKSLHRKIIYQATEHFEAPNWSLDGKYVIFNQGGRLYKLFFQSPIPKLINTDFADRCNNDHGISPQGDKLALSNSNNKLGTSLIYILPINGGMPRLITEKGPSYWHGWSPDGKTIAYCAERNSNYDVYTISINGSKEKRLTNTPGLDDGPDYSPDGNHIYFNSVRTGIMQIWRMDSNGSNEQQITFDKYNDWFPHPSPDGEKVVFLSYIDEVDPGSHPPFKQVMLRMINTDGGKPIVLAELLGGQGTINVPSWSPDSKGLAFVSYELIE